MTTRQDLPAASFAKLCSLERKLQKWGEEECNGTIQWDDNDQPRRHAIQWDGSPSRQGRLVPNSEAKWLAEAEALAKQLGGHIYHQGDPRGCALYFYRDSDLEGRRFPIDQIYSSAALACCD